MTDSEPPKNSFALADHLRHLVYAYRLNQRHLAEKLWVEPRTLSRWLAAPGASSRTCPPYAVVELTRRMYLAGELQVLPVYYETVAPPPLPPAS